MAKKKKEIVKEDYKVRIIKSDLPELQQRMQFLTGNAWDISIGVAGVEGIKEGDYLKVTEVPQTWCAEVVLEWLHKRKRTRRKVAAQMEEEIAHIKFVEGLVKRQLMDMVEKELKDL